MKFINDTLKSGMLYLFDFLMNPIEGIKNAKDIPWKELIVVQVCYVALTGILLGFIANDFFTFIWAIFLYPIISLIVNFISGVLVHYGILFTAKRKLNFRHIYTIVFLSSVPAYLIRVISPILISIDLIGLGLASILLSIGLIYKFNINRKISIRLSLSLYSVIVIGFLISWLLAHEKAKQFRELSSYNEKQSFIEVIYNKFKANEPSEP